MATLFQEPQEASCSLPRGAQGLCFRGTRGEQGSSRVSTSEGLVKEQQHIHGPMSRSPTPSRVCANLSVMPG